MRKYPDKSNLGYKGLIFAYIQEKAVHGEAKLAGRGSESRRLANHTAPALRKQRRGCMPLLSSLPPLVQSRIPSQGVRMLLHTVDASLPSQLTYSSWAALACPEAHLLCESKCSQFERSPHHRSQFPFLVDALDQEAESSFVFLIKDSYLRFLEIFYLSFDGYRQGKTHKIRYSTVW